MTIALLMGVTLLRGAKSDNYYLFAYFNDVNDDTTQGQQVRFDFNGSCIPITEEEYNRLKKHFGHGAAAERLSLNGTWQFMLAPNDSVANEYRNFWRTDYDASAFTTIPVPSNWAVQGFDEPTYKGKWPTGQAPQGFYLYRFKTPEGWDTMRTYLDFGGVWASCEVWLNGQYVDRHESGFTSFRMNTLRMLRPSGEENVLAVRVRQESRGSRFDVNDDWSLGGIYRDVALVAMPLDRWLATMHAQTTFDKTYTDADLQVKVMVNDRRNKAKADIYKPNGGDPYALRYTLTDAEGHMVLQETDTIDSHAYTGREDVRTMHISHPRHWTAETPYLYHLKVELVEAGNNVTQYEEKRIGFRQISTEGGIFTLNGQPIHLRGVNRHDEWPTAGRATTREHWLRDLQLMKAANINYVRACHYQHVKGFIELCDSIGMYVGEEVSIGGGDSYFYNPTYMDASLLRTYETVTRDL